MAMADYYLCDQCGAKAIYDANWGYLVEASGVDICIICERCKVRGYEADVTSPKRRGHPGGIPPSHVPQWAPPQSSG